MKKTRYRFNAAALVIFVIAVAVYFIQEKGAQQRVTSSGNHSWMVVNVYDGDTVGVLVNGIEERIRLIGIDAPEMGQVPWGEKAKRFLEDLLASQGRTVTLETDVEQRDKYNRLLAYLRMKDGRIVNEELLLNGYAMLFTVPPNVKYVERFKAAQSSARQKKLGIWGDGGLTQSPPDYRKEHPRK